MPRFTNPYSRFKPDELFLRDELAIDRTLLANERTFLAYLRTAIALVLAGVTFIHFASNSWLEILGYISVPIGIIILILATIRYRKVRANILGVRKKLDIEEIL